MSINNLDLVFKAFINKLATDSEGKKYFNELGAFTINMHNKEIWSDDINESPVQAISDGVIEEYTLLELTEDITVPSQASWYPTDNEGNRLSDWVSDKYGSQYVVHLFDANNNEIFPTDDTEWFFNYQTGILTFNNTNAYTKPYKLSGYRYIGEKGAGGSGGVNIKAFPECEIPYNIGFQEDVSPIDTLRTISFDLSQDSVLAGKKVELAGYSHGSSGYNDGDYYNILIDDMQGNPDSISTIENHWYTREVAESENIGGGTSVYGIPTDCTIIIEFHNTGNAGNTAKKIWPKLKFLYSN